MCRCPSSWLNSRANKLINLIIICKNSIFIGCSTWQFVTLWELYKLKWPCHSLAWSAGLNCSLDSSRTSRILWLMHEVTPFDPLLQSGLNKLACQLCVVFVFVCAWNCWLMIICQCFGDMHGVMFCAFIYSDIQSSVSPDHYWMITTSPFSEIIITRLVTFWTVAVPQKRTLLLIYEPGWSRQCILPSWCDGERKKGKGRDYDNKPKALNRE